MPRRSVQNMRPVMVLALVLAAWATPLVTPTAARQLPGRHAGSGIVIGLEYALLDSPQLVRGMAQALAETGMPGMKHYVETVDWGAMQRGPDRPIDFSRLDRFVLEYQRAGFTELTVSLKGHSSWASKDVKALRSTNGSPKPQYRGLYQQWITAVVERYDGDGAADVPGLRWPVRYIEIGNEFSSYQPEPVGEYLETLELAYRAAHAASDRVQVGHAAFLTTPTNMNVARPAAYDSAWAATRREDNHHGLADLRAVLDRPELFDFINLHNLGDPYEIEHLMRWIRYETGRRGYTKPVLISDTTPTAYVAWGAATACRGPGLGLIIPPAREPDRCRLAGYFSKLVDQDRAALAWTRGFVAADHVQRAVIAAEQGVKLINLAFATDLPFLTSKALRAGAGISAWGGALRMNMGAGRVLERYPSFQAIRQLIGHLDGYRTITRVATPDPQARVYRIEGARGPTWIAWRDPGGVLLPEDGTPGMEVELEVGAERVTVEPVITAMGESRATATPRPSPGGRIRMTLTHTPLYVRRE